MTIIFPGDGQPLDMVVTLRALATDLERMTMFCPGAAELADAPVLDRWSFGIRGVSALSGLVVGHPLLGRRAIGTSEIYAIDIEGGWARTWSRFYKLGCPSTG